MGLDRWRSYDPIKTLWPDTVVDSDCSDKKEGMGRSDGDE